MVSVEVNSSFDYLLISGIYFSINALISGSQECIYTGSMENVLRWISYIASSSAVLKQCRFLFSSKRFITSFEENFNVNSTSDIYLSKVFSGMVIVFMVWMVNYFVIKSIAISVVSQIKGSSARVTSTICVYDVFMIIR